MSRPHVGGYSPPNAASAEGAGMALAPRLAALRRALGTRRAAVAGLAALLALLGILLGALRLGWHQPAHAASLAGQALAHTARLALGTGWPLLAAAAGLALGVFLSDRRGRAALGRLWAAPPITVVRWMFIAAGLLAVLVVVIAVLPPRFTASRHFDKAADELKAQNDVRTTMLQALAGGVLVVGAYFTYRQLRAGAHRPRLPAGSGHHRGGPDRLCARPCPLAAPRARGRHPTAAHYGCATLLARRAASGHQGYGRPTGPARGRAAAAGSRRAGRGDSAWPPPASPRRPSAARPYRGRSPARTAPRRQPPARTARPRQPPGRPPPRRQPPARTARPRQPPRRTARRRQPPGRAARRACRPPRRVGG